MRCYALGKWESEMERSTYGVRETSPSYLGEMATQVARFAHDVQSPLCALTAVIESLGDRETLDPTTNLLNQIALRIKSMSDAYLQEFKTRMADWVPGQRVVEKVCLGEMLELLIQEKRFALAAQNKVTIRFRGKALADQLRVVREPLASALANVLQNAVEASPEHSEVQVVVSGSLTQYRIEVRDSGAGLAAGVSIGQIGVTHGKSTGRGIGLNQAIWAAESLGGTLDWWPQEQGMSFVFEIPNPR
jgi:signal transduction histidine kinase